MISTCRSLGRFSTALVEKNHLQLVEIRTKSKAGQQRAIRNGIWVGRVPYGWERVHQISEHEDGQPRDGVNYWIRPNHRLRDKLTRIYELRAAERSWNSIERATGIDQETVRGILKNSRNREIVGDELWGRAQHVAVVQRADSDRAYLLSGILRCPWDRTTEKPDLSHRLIGQAAKTWEMAKGKATAPSAPRYICRNYRTEHPWRSISERLIWRHIEPVLQCLVVAEADRELVASRLESLRPRSDDGAARIEEIARIERRRRRIEEGVAASVIRHDSAQEMLAKLDKEEAGIPPPQIESDDIRADLSLLSSLSGLIAQLEWPADREQIAIANRLLRDVIIRVEWPDRPVKYKPRIVLSDRYVALYNGLRSLS